MSSKIDYQHKLLIHHFGDVPNGWSVVSLADIFAERAEPNANLSKYPLYSFTIEKGVTPKTERYERSFLLKAGEENEYKLVHPKDFVINPMNLRFGAIGYSKLAKVVSVSAYYDILRIKNSNVDIDFLYEFLSSRAMFNIYNRVATGSLLEKQRVHCSEFKGLKVFFPPANEQKRIGDIIRCWNTNIKKAEMLISAKINLKKALMQYLLGDKQLQEFAEQGVQKVSLGEVTAINPPLSVTLSGTDKVSFLTMTDVSEKGTVIRQQHRTFAQVKNGFTAFEDNDVLVAKITPCFENGKGALVTSLQNGVGFGSTEFHVLRATPNIIPQFLFYHTKTDRFRKQGERSMTGSAGQKRVPAEFLISYRIILPSPERQRQVVDILNASDEEIRLLERQVVSLKEQKRGLMQQLLTGKKRIKVDKQAEREAVAV